MGEWKETNCGCCGRDTERGAERHKAWCFLRHGRGEEARHGLIGELSAVYDELGFDGDELAFDRDAALRAAMRGTGGECYSDGWPERAIDAMAVAIYEAAAGMDPGADNSETHGVRDAREAFGRMAEHERDEWRHAAVAARAFVARQVAVAVNRKRDK